MLNRKYSFISAIDKKSKETLKVFLANFYKDFSSAKENKWRLFNRGQQVLKLPSAGFDEINNLTDDELGILCLIAANHVVYHSRVFYYKETGYSYEDMISHLSLEAFRELSKLNKYRDRHSDVIFFLLDKLMRHAGNIKIKNDNFTKKKEIISDEMLLDPVSDIHKFETWHDFDKTIKEMSSKRNTTKLLRNKKILFMYYRRDKTIIEISKELKLSQPHVHSILKSYRKILAKISPPTTAGAQQFFNSNACHPKKFTAKLTKLRKDIDNYNYLWYKNKYTSIVKKVDPASLPVKDRNKYLKGNSEWRSIPWFQRKIRHYYIEQYMNYIVKSYGYIRYPQTSPVGGSFDKYRSPQ